MPTISLLRPRGPIVRVLAVDDDDLMLRVLERRLGDVVTLVTASSGERALALLERDRDFARLVFDVGMLPMSGIELFRRIADRWPEISARVVFLTGGAVDEPSRGFLASVPNPQLIKQPGFVDALLPLLGLAPGA